MYLILDHELDAAEFSAVADEAEELKKRWDAGLATPKEMTSENFNKVEAWYRFAYEFRFLFGAELKAARTGKPGQVNLEKEENTYCNFVCGCGGGKFCDLGKNNCLARQKLQQRYGKIWDHPYINVSQIRGIWKKRNYMPRQTIMCAYMGDIFHPEVPWSALNLLFMQLKLTPHRVILITSNPQGLADYLRHSPYRDCWPKDFQNVTVAVSIRTNRAMQMKMPVICQLNAPRLQIWLSPILGKVKMETWLKKLGSSLDSVWIMGPYPPCYIEVELDVYQDAIEQFKRCGVRYHLRHMGNRWYLQSRLPVANLTLDVGDYDVLTLRNIECQTEYVTPNIFGDVTSDSVLVAVGGDKLIAVDPEEIHWSGTGPWIEATRDRRQFTNPMDYLMEGDEA